MMPLSRDTEFFYSPSRNGITFREPSETRYPLTEPNDWRPLVVIDPEDREQVERLVTAYASEHGCLIREKMQAALRGLIEPPKPEEPTGLGALVERSDGRRWVRGPDDKWTNLDATGAYLNWSRWSDVNEGALVVRVLSEGVTP